MTEPDSTVSTEAATEGAEAAESPREFLATLPKWKILLVGTAALSLVGGLATSLLVSGGTEQEQSAGGGGPEGVSPSPLATGLLPTEPGGTETGGEAGAAAAADPAWSEAFFSYGFSFFVGFAIGYAVRAFLKVALLFVGLFALGLFALTYFKGGEGQSFVQVNWEVLDSAFSRFVDRVGEQAGAFRSFITGSLPNAGLAGLGIFTGFKKNR